MTVISLPLILETQASTCKHTKVFKDREEKKKKTQHAEPKHQERN